MIHSTGFQQISSLLLSPLGLNIVLEVCVYVSVWGQRRLDG